MTSAAGDRLARGLFSVVVALVVLHPLRHRGYALTYDMVFVPHPAATPSLVGRGPEVPRAVPSDLLVALPSWLVGGAAVQRLVLLLVLAAAAYGASRLVRGPLVAGLTAGLFAVWNPWVAERLAIGQWALLVGYAATPWCVAAVLGVRRRTPGSWPRLVACLAAAACGGASAALVAVGTSVVVAVVARGVDGTRGRAVALLLGAATLLNAPWWVPALLRPDDLPVDPDSVAAFALRSEHPLALLPTALTGGGIWNADVVPTERSGGLAYVGVGLVVVAAVGLWQQHRSGSRAALPLAAAAAVGLAVALLSSLPGGVGDLAVDLVTGLPGGGLLRDAHKFVAPLVLSAAVGLGGAVAALLRARSRLREVAVPATVVLVLAVPLCLPSLATGLDGRLAPVRYPADYTAVADLLALDAGSDDVAVVLPWQPYRAYAWTGGRTVLDVLPRWLETTTVVDDDLPVGSTMVSGEGPLAAALDPVLSSGGPVAGQLARRGVRWVVVESRTGTPPVDPGALRGLVPVRDGPDLRLLRVPGVPRGAGATLADRARPPLVPVVLADLLAAATAVAAAVGLVLARRGRPRRRTTIGAEGPSAGASLP